MKIGVASDHRGIRVKSQILALLTQLSHEGVDYGPAEGTSVDYPDYAARVAHAVASGEIDRGARRLDVGADHDGRYDALGAGAVEHVVDGLRPLDVTVAVEPHQWLARCGIRPRCVGTAEHPCRARCLEGRAPTRPRRPA